MALRFSLLALAGLLIAPVAIAGPPPPKPATHPHMKTARLSESPHREKGEKSEKPIAPPPGKSVGSPTAGRLLGGARLAESDHVRVVPVYVPGDSRWGLESLVSMIDRAAKTIRKQFPDAQLSVGHLSRPGGGEIDRHASHESGRDADVGFYVRNQQGKTIYADHFVTFKGDGTAPSWPGAQFDDAKNWQLVTSFVSDASAHVTHIFVASPIRARLLAYAEKIGAPAAIRTRAAELMAQPRGSLPHDDHFHVRVACPAGSTELSTNKCVEIPLPHHGRALANARTGKPHVTAPTHAGHHAAPPAKAPVAAAPPEPKEKAEESESKNDFLPNLAPSIPGLDSAVIPAPLAGAKPEPATPVQPEGEKLDPLPPIDDPDGVLENR